MAKSVSVVICTWNRARLLGQTLETFLRLRVPEGVTWELLVVNNNCTDDTDEVARRYADRLPLVLCHEPRPGKSNACNHAIARARGDYLLWTDDDVLIDPGWMEQLLDAFQRYQAELVFGKVEPWWETAPPGWFSPLCAPLLALVDLGAEPEVLTDPWKAGAGVNHAFRRDALLRLGPYRTDLGPSSGQGSGEDSDLFQRACAAGLRLAYTPAAVVHHYVPAARCGKAYHRRRAWVDSPEHLRLLRQVPGLPQLLGLPRYFIRRNLGYAREFLCGLVKRQPSRAFFYELKLIRFAGLLYHSLLQKG